MEVGDMVMGDKVETLMEVKNALQKKQTSLELKALNLRKRL